MPSYTTDPTGGYTITRDDGTSFKSAIPYGMPQQTKGLIDLSAGAPQMQAPLQPSPELVQAAQPGPDERLAMNGEGASPIDPSIIAGMNRADAPAGPAVAGSHATPASAFAAPPMPGGGPSTSDMSKMLNAPLPQAPPDAAAPPAGGARGAVFATPPTQGAPSSAPHGGGPVAKPGFIAHGKTEQTTALPEYVKQGLVDSTQKDIAATNFQAQVEARQAVDQYQIQLRAQEEQRQLAAREQLREQERQAKVQGQMQKVQDLSADAAAGKIDRGHIWANGGRQAAITAMALGAFASAMPGGNGQNTALNVINKAVDDDLKEQEQNLANKNAAVRNQQNVLGAMRETFGDERAAFSAAKAIKLQDAAQQVELNAQKYKSPLVQAQAAKAVEAMRQKSYALFGEAEKTATATSYVNGRLGTAGPGAAAVVKDAAAYGDDVEKAKINESDASIANVDTVLKKYEGKGEIPGIQPENVLKRGIKGAADFVAGQGSGDKLFYNQEERGNRQTLEYAKADLRHAITGAGMSDTERKNLDDMIQSSQSYQDIAKSAQIIKARVAYHKANLAGGHMPEAVQLYEQRRKGWHAATDAKVGPNVKPAGEE